MSQFNLVTREQKGLALTHAEMDSNLEALAGAGKIMYFKDYDLATPIVFDNVAPSSTVIIMINGLTVAYEINDFEAEFAFSSGGVKVDSEGVVFGAYQDSLGNGGGYFNDDTVYSYNISEQNLLLNLSDFEATFTGNIRYFTY